eukprot:scaffold1391_cov137-Pinguiococcus_pyrenoidosus.AAC.3
MDQTRLKVLVDARLPVKSQRKTRSRSSAMAPRISWRVSGQRKTPNPMTRNSEKPSWACSSTNEAPMIIRLLSKSWRRAHKEHERVTV